MNLLNQIHLPSGRSTLNLGFGCVGLMRIPVPSRRKYLLRTAVELGITHFDVARMYGLGAAEGVLGSSLKPWRDRLTFATKFGIPRSVPNPFLVNLKYGARWALALRPTLLKRFKKKSSVPHVRHVDFSLEELERSLETSLHQLQTDHLDLLFLHEPRAGDTIPDGLGQALEAKVAQGKLGAFGVSGYMSDVAYFMQNRPDICGKAIQYNYSMIKTGREDVPLRNHAFTGMFRVIEGTHEKIAGLLAREKALARGWSDRLGLDVINPENLGIVILASSLALNPGGMVIFSTTRPKRLRLVMEKLTTNSFSTESLLDFRDAVSRSIAADHAE